MDSQKKRWPAALIRVFAVLNLLMGSFGLAALSNSVTLRLTNSPWPQDPPYLAQAYYVRSGINLLFVVLTILGGVYLWRVKRRAWTLCRMLFIGQIAYFVLDGLHVPLLMDFGERASIVSMALGASAGTGNMGTAIQTLTGYPIIALIGLKIAFNKLPGVSPPSVPV